MEIKQTLQQLIERVEKNWPEVASPESKLAMTLLRLSDHIRARTERALQPFDLSQAAFEVLFALRSSPERQQMTPKQLSNAILITSGGMTKVLIHLENMGAIERRNHKHDGRSKMIILTDSGHKLVEQAMQAVVRVDNVLFARTLPSAVMATLNNHLLNIINTIEDE